MNWHIEIREIHFPFGPSIFMGILSCEYEGAPPELGETIGPLTATDSSEKTWQIEKAFVKRVDTKHGTTRIVAETIGPFIRTDLSRFKMVFEPSPHIVDSPS